jgi:ribosomal protein L18E
MARKNSFNASMNIKFNKKLYKLKAIKSAIKTYRQLADFNLKAKGKYFEVNIENIEAEVRPVIKDEFCNYVLFLMKS